MRKPSSPSITQQQGLSLVELLIAMVLGLFLTAGALEMMLASRNLHRTTDDLSRIQENGRFALSFLAKDIRMAGHQSADFDGRVFWDEACDTMDPCSDDGGGANTDRIGILMRPSNGVDCLGTDVGNTTTIVNVYFINAINGVSSLFCRGFNPSTGTWFSNAQPLVDGIENLQILYGLWDPAARRIERYVSEDQVTNWADIGAVKIAVLVNNGQAAGNSDNVARTFRILDTPDIVFNDRHSRQVFATTTTVNNIIYQNQGANL